MKLMPWRNKNKSESTEASPPSVWKNEALDRFFDRAFRDPWSLDWRAGIDDLLPFDAWDPPVDVTESDEEIHVRSEIPGVDPDDLSITVSGEMLTLSGEKAETSETRDEQHYRAERRFGSFHRSVQLPSAVDPDNVTAEYKNGVLTVTLKRREGATVKRIPVSVKK